MHTTNHFTKALLALTLAAAVVSCRGIVGEPELAVQDEVAVVPSAEFEVTEYSAAEFAALFEGIEAPVDTKCAAIRYEIAKLTYASVTGSGAPITLSMKIAYPQGILTKYHDPDFIVLDNHPTIFSEAESPWSCNPIALAKAMDDALVVCPDYEGFGITSDRDHPYLAHDLNARQSVDAVLAAIDYINGKKGIKMSKGYYLMNYGYSQGGGVALAVHKYIENNLSKADQARINLKKSYCGGGPYDPGITMRKYFQEDELEYPTLLPMVLIGFKAAYPEIMDAFPLEDFFNPEFLATGIIDMIRSKQYKNKELLEFIERTYGSNRCSDILSPAVYDENSPQRKAMDACFERSNVASGWAPVKRVDLMHSREDQIVPVENALSAYEGLQPGNVSEIEWALLSPEHVVAGVLYYIKYMGLNIIPGALDHFLN